MSAFKSVTLTFLVIALPAMARAGNPLIPHVYAADPSAHVWPGDDRLWLYTSDDRPETDTHDTMASYHVFSTTNLVDWMDHGMVLHLKDVAWAANLAGFSGTGYVTGFDHPNEYVAVLAQVAKPGKWRLTVRYAAPTTNEVARLLVNVTRGREQWAFPQTDGFAELDLGVIQLQAGDNVIRLIEPRRNKPAGSIAVDYFKLERVEAFPRFELN
jgi:hypothetical protein